MGYMVGIHTAAAILLSMIALSASAQTAQPRSSNPHGQRAPSTDQNTESQDLPSLPDEMRARLAIERAEIEHKKILDSAKELGELTNEVRKRYADAGRLSSDEVKKLGTIEKLAKRILSHAGGAQVDGKAEFNGKMSLGEAVDQLGAIGEKVSKDVTAETRFVVSASVIFDTNQLIHLSRFIRRSYK